MKYFMIKYHSKGESPDQWHTRVKQFIAAIDAQPDLEQRITYRCFKMKDGLDYFHIAGAADDGAVKVLQSKDFFKGYSEATRDAAEGEVTVVPLELIAETHFVA